MASSAYQPLPYLLPSHLHCLWWNISVVFILFPVSKNTVISPLAALVIFLVYLNLHVYIIFCCKKVCFFPFMANMWWLNHSSIHVFLTVLDCESLQYPLPTVKFPFLVVLTTAVVSGYKHKCVEGNLTGTFILQIYNSSSSLHSRWHPNIRFSQGLTIPNVSSLVWRLKTNWKTVGYTFNSHATPLSYQQAHFGWYVVSVLHSNHNQIVLLMPIPPKQPALKYIKGS